MQDENDPVLHAENSTHLFKKETIERMLNDFRLILQQVSIDPSLLLRDLTL
ncbi:hypothetical protein GK047_11555 [Paenibacillus sp. SYP-B3998]|uniref:Uncharacterized protein n=1 Tax=Paenibacillus sp. SYP-B3998 TaxID=2678564 RepID=A0A6G3ZX44_9BACL|nr:hypothetical protein [Paenibacillus sp. SYP-B3998]NEW06650.1 hypothetical protein [Paenibacillus sp. SYP-B3998]